MLIEALPESELDSIRPLLLELLITDAGDPASPGLRSRLDEALPRTRATFRGENHVFAAREQGRILAFCWCVVFDPGTGLEGEVAELYVLPGERGRGLAGRLLGEATRLFAERRVTFASVWTDPGNQVALRAYEAAGFTPTEQLVLTWNPPDGG
ncbi:MAG: GNAT family N-acetyltransferase [Candidatus Dormiibacterota bacterium]